MVVPASSHVSINSETGVVYAARSFDYEQIKSLELFVKAQNGGSPPLSSNVSVENTDPGPERQRPSGSVSSQDWWFSGG